MADGPPPPVRYRGRAIDCRPGETLARALARRGIRVLGRSIRYHRPRTAFCGVGFCSNCLVRVDGRPNVRACRLRPEPGARVETENAWPSPTLDLLGVLDLVFPGGIDTLRGFRRPRWAIPAYQGVVRRLAGFGRIADLSPPPAPSPAVERETDLLVVGAGAAGAACARRLSDAGAELLLVDRGPIPEALPRAGRLERTTVVFLPRPDPDAARPFVALGVGHDGAGVRIRAKRVVVATGGYDAGLLFSGSDRPGVVTADGAEALAPEPGVPGFARAVVFGAADRAEGLLDRWGERIEAIVAPGAVGPAVVRKASDLGIPIYPRTLLVEAVGARRVRAVRLHRRGGAERFRIACDALVLAHRRLPHPQLLFQAGARMEWRSGPGAYYPTLSDGFETTVPGLFALGETAGFVSERAAESGERLGETLAHGRPSPDGLPRVRQEGPNELEGYYRELIGRLPRRSKTIACACEDVLLREIEEASARGYRGIEVIKRYTGLGTGLCQGRYCLPEALLLLSLWEGRPPEEVGYITQRPPVVPTPLFALAALAGSRAPEEGG